MKQNDYVSITEDPVARDEVEDLRDRLVELWEDVLIQTEGGVRLVTAGRLRHILDHLLNDVPLDGEPEHLFKRN